MATNEIHQYDAGLDFRVQILDQKNIVVDISSATTKEFHFQKPDGSYLVKPAVFLTDGKDGWLRYFTLPNDLDQHGTWKLQAFVIFPVGNQRSSDISKFKVFQNLPE